MDKLPKQEYFNRLIKASAISFTIMMSAFVSIVIGIITATIVGSLSPFDWTNTMVVLVNNFAIGVFALAVHQYVSDSLEIFMEDDSKSWTLAFINKTIEENPQIEL